MPSSRSPSTIHILAILLAGLFHSCRSDRTGGIPAPPDILFAVSDDQSWQHAGACGCNWISTPAFDEIAESGVLFRNAFVASPGCSPSRAAFLTGRYCWEIKEAGNHASSFPLEFRVFPDILEEHGYRVGFTGKGWGPGNWQVSGRTRNPAGDEWSRIRYETGGNDPRPAGQISDVDYAGNFREFLDSLEPGKPFFFWYGAREPHRAYEAGAGIRQGMDPASVNVPGFLPDRPEIRSDLLDYALEIEWFDRHLLQMLEMLKESGRLENTLVIVTGDNGMPFPSAKATCFEFGIHVPMAISWPKRIPANREVEDLVSFVDLTPTILEAAGIEVRDSLEYSGRSLMEILISGKEGFVEADRTAVFASRERHSSSRWNNLGYPVRAMRTGDYLYIQNFKPERWPAGAPQLINPDGSPGEMHYAYTDIDACPSKDFLIEHREDPDIEPYFRRAVAKRPAKELYDIRKDPACMHNLAGEEEYAEILRAHAEALMKQLEKTSDPRITGKDPDVFKPVRFREPPDMGIPGYSERTCGRPHGTIEENL